MQKKSMCMYFSIYINKHCGLPEIYLRNCVCQFVKEVKYLGVMIHCNNVTIKTNSEEVKKYFCSSFKSKNIMDLLDRNIHATDPNKNYEVLERTLKEVQTECFPERIVWLNGRKHKKTPWITTRILKSINRRNKLYKVLKRTKTDAISYVTKKINFNRYRNVLCKTIAFAKRKYYIHIFEQSQRDMKKTWATLSDILNRNTKKIFTRYNDNKWARLQR